MASNRVHPVSSQEKYVLYSIKNYTENGHVTFGLVEMTSNGVHY